MTNTKGYSKTVVMLSVMWTKYILAFSSTRLKFSFSGFRIIGLKMALPAHTVYTCDT